MEEELSSNEKRDILRNVATYRELCRQIRRKSGGTLFSGFLILVIWYMSYGQNIQKGFEGGGFVLRRGGCAFDAGFRLGNLERHGLRQLEIEGSAVVEGDFAGVVFTEIENFIADHVAVESDLFEGFGVAENVIAAVFVGVHELLGIEEDDIDFIVRMDAFVSDGAGFEVFEFQIQDCAPVSGRVEVAIEDIEKLPVHIQHHPAPNVNHLRRSHDTSPACRPRPAHESRFVVPNSYCIKRPASREVGANPWVIHLSGSTGNSTTTYSS